MTISSADRFCPSDTLKARAKAIQLLVVDIDGTIAGPSNQISPRVQAAIAQVQAQGIPVTIATGRMFCSARRFHETLNSKLPLIAYQGAWIQESHADSPLKHFPLDPEQIHYLLDYFEQSHLRDRLELHVYLNDRLHVREITATTETYCERSGIEPIAIGDLRHLAQSPLTKLLALSEETQLIQACLAELTQLTPPTPIHFTTSVATFLEATHPQGNKGEAVRYLAESILGLEASQVMTIGDNCNDIEMLEYAGIGIAMGDAPPQVQAIANAVTGTVEEDGVAQAIEALLVSH